MPLASTTLFSPRTGSILQGFGKRCEASRKITSLRTAECEGGPQNDRRPRAASKAPAQGTVDQKGEDCWPSMFGTTGRVGNASRSSPEENFRRVDRWGRE